MKPTPRVPLVSVRAQDCVFEYMRGSGNGGQKKQKTSSKVRCSHPPSGAVGVSEANREQSRNKQDAFRKMAESKEFAIWMKVETARAMGIEPVRPIEEVVEEEMQKVRVEVKDDEGNWVRE